MTKKLSTDEKPHIFTLYSPLLFSLFYFMALFFDDKSWFAIVVIFVTYGIQCGLYHVMVVARKELLGPAIFAAIVIGVASSGLNHSSYAFYWFCAYFAALKFNRYNAIGTFVFIVLAIVLTAEIHNYHHAWFYLPVFIPSLALFTYGLFDRQAQTHRKVQKHSDEHIQQLAKVAERERIARDLHDVMGHSLATIALKSQLAHKLGKAGNIDAAIQEIGQVATITSETLSEMRSVVSGYKIQSLEQRVYKLIASIEELHFTVDSNMQFPRFEATQESTLTLALTETFTNVMKHSTGSILTLRTQQPTLPDNVFIISVHDNGAVDSVREGNGLTGMRERLADIGATLDITVQNGMCVTITLPMTSNNTNESNGSES